jgi:hypothetical protein
MNSDSQVGGYEQIETAIKFLFSWAVLMPICVIIGGKLLAKVLKLTFTTTQLFKITIPRMFVIQATDNEVIMGFTSFIITLVLIAIPAGPRAYLMFREQFGIDPGHFNSLCVLSSFSTVIWTFALYVLLFVAGRLKASTPDPIAEEHEKLIDQLSRKQ